MKKWQCIVCGFIYDEEEGLPDEGIAAGTAWNVTEDDLLEHMDFVDIEDFEMIEID